LERPADLGLATLCLVHKIPMLIHPDPDDPNCADVMIDAATGGRPYRFRLDTGAARTELVADEYLASLPAHASHTSTGVFGIPETQHIVTIPDLVIGQLVIGSADVVRAVPAAGRPNLLGMDVLQRYCCEFRFDRELLVVADSPAPKAGLPLQLDEGGHVFLELNWGGATASGC
jgi:Aspartyl protease